MADTTNALVIRLREFGSDSVSMVSLPNHFEISAQFTDNYEEGKEPDQLYLVVSINSMEDHEGDGNSHVHIFLFPAVEIPTEYFGEFVIEDAGDRVIDEMLDCICWDIAAYLKDDDEDKEPYFDVIEYEPRWREHLDKCIGDELKEWEEQNTDKDK